MFSVLKYLRNLCDIRCCGLKCFSCKCCNIQCCSIECEDKNKIYNHISIDEEWNMIFNEISEEDSL